MLQTLGLAEQVEQYILRITIDDDDDEVTNIADWVDTDIEVTLDSRCCTRVLPARSAPGYQVHDSPGS